MQAAQKKSYSPSLVYFFLIFTTVSWGIMPMCVKWLLIAKWSPVTITAMRYIFCSVILFVLIFYQQKIRHTDHSDFLPRGLNWLYLILMGLTGILLNNILMFTGLVESTVINCTLITATLPAITALFAFFFVKERLSSAAWAGIVISFFGVVFIVSQGSLRTIMSINFGSGDILFLLSQVAWALYSILALKVMRQLSVITTSAWAGLFGAIETIIYGLYVDQFAVTPLSYFAIGCFIFLIIVAGVLGMVFWNIGVENVGPSVSSVFLNITPIVGIVGGVLAFHEAVSASQLIGAALICFGVYCTTHSNQLKHLCHFLLIRHQ